MTCGGSFPPARLAPLPAASTASSTASLGTADASTPSEIQSVRRPPATIPVCVIDADHVGPAAAAQAKHQTQVPQANHDQLWLSGIGSGPQERMLNIFRITGLTKVFGIHQRVDQAIAARK